MRAALILPLLFLLFLLPAQGDHREAYERARMAEATLDADRLIDLWTEARDSADASGDASHAFFCGYRLALQLQQMERTRDALRTIENTLAGFSKGVAAGLAWTSARDFRRLRLELLFLRERCLAEAGRVSDGWAALRHAAAESSHFTARTLNAARDPLTASSFPGWTSEERALAWRIIGREAEYLDATGRTLEALALLDRTAPLAAANASAADEFEQSCADKLALNRTLLLDFLGWSERALSEQTELTEVLDRRGRDRSYWVARINALRNLSQWEGPTSETLAAAREAASHLRKRGGGRTLFDQMVVRMERDLEKTAENRNQLQADARRLREAGFQSGAAWTERDALVADAEDTNPPGLDPRFIQLLSTARLQGRKTSEPTLYREFAHYLLRQNRPGEAIPLFEEAIRLTRSFGWTLHLPALYTALATAFLDDGDTAAAAATWATLDQCLKATPEMPLVRVMHTEVARARYQARLGRLAVARATLEKAKSLADTGGLPDYQRTPITEADLDGAVALGHKTRTPAAGQGVHPVDLQPLAIRSEGPADMPLRARFVLTNTSRLPATGTLQVNGPGVRWAQEANEERFSIEVSGGNETSVSRPLTIAPGEQIVFATTATSGTVGEVSLTWHADNVRSHAHWSVSRSSTLREDAVLNASALHRSGFYTQSITHQITRGQPATDTVPFRLRASEPTRLEYYQDGRLIGVDAQGDGDFTQAGDVLPPAPSPDRAPSGASPAPRATFTHEGHETEIEVFLFSTEHTPSGASEITLDAEVFNGTEWQIFARSVLKSTQP